MNRTRRILSALGLTVALASLPACLVTARGSGTWSTGGAVVAYDAPPEPRVENPQPMAGHVWVRGNWTMRNNQWVWIDGHWERARAGYQWTDGRWEPHNGSWHWVAGTWTAGNGPNGTIVTGDGGVVVTGGGNGGYVPPRDQIQDHRYDGSNSGGGVIVGNGGGVVVTGGGAGGRPPLVASNGAGTVIAGNGGVTVIGPTVAPPPVRVENPGPARRGYVWIEGNWQWANNNYEWVPGHWERSKAGHRWQPVRWQQNNGVWIRIEGSWTSN